MTTTTAVIIRGIKGFNRLLLPPKCVNEACTTKLAHWNGLVFAFSWLETVFCWWAS